MASELSFAVSQLFSK